MFSFLSRIKGLVPTIDIRGHQYTYSLIHPLANISLLMLFFILSGCNTFGPIHSAAAMGDLTKLNMLLKSNPDLVFTKDRQGLTPLHYAARAGHKDAVDLLLSNKADVNARDNVGATPLHYAAGAGHKDIVDLLLANKADVNAKTSYKDVVIPSGLTPLHIAATKGFKDVVELLLANKADVNAKDSNYWTPLHFAVFSGVHRSLVELLLVNKAEVNSKTIEGWTPLFIAKSNFHGEVAELLRQYGGLE